MCIVTTPLFHNHSQTFPGEGWGGWSCLERVMFPPPNSGNTVVFDIECMCGKASGPQRQLGSFYRSSFCLLVCLAVLGLIVLGWWGKGLRWILICILAWFMSPLVLCPLTLCWTCWETDLLALTEMLVRYDWQCISRSKVCLTKVFPILFYPLMLKRPFSLTVFCV